MLVRLELSLVVRASLTPPSLSISLLTFPEKDGVESHSFSVPISKVS